MSQMHPAIAETISIGQDAPLPEQTQPAYHAVVHLVVPGTHNGGPHHGEPIGEAGAADYIAETLRDQFLDWQYVTIYEDGDGAYQSPIHITVSKPYVEGTFLGDVES